MRPVTPTTPPFVSGCQKRRDIPRRHHSDGTTTQAQLWQQLSPIHVIGCNQRREQVSFYCRCAMAIVVFNNILLLRTAAATPARQRDKQPSSVEQFPAIFAAPAPKIATHTGTPLPKNHSQKEFNNARLQRTHHGHANCKSQARCRTGRLRRSMNDQPPRAFRHVYLRHVALGRTARGTRKSTYHSTNHRFSPLQATYAPSWRIIISAQPQQQQQQQGKHSSPCASSAAKTHLEQDHTATRGSISASAGNLLVPNNVKSPRPPRRLPLPTASGAASAAF